MTIHEKYDGATVYSPCGAKGVVRGDRAVFENEAWVEWTAPSPAFLPGYKGHGTPFSIVPENKLLEMLQSPHKPQGKHVPELTDWLKRIAK